MTTSQSLQADRNILGYQLQDRIGAGGYGEVWSAIAPGGLLKAVKIVYGYHDEKRAQAELKALDRVKKVRHPFLLSLERIEVFDSQLIVVSELADKSMAELFNEYVEKGEPGIPRDGLVRSMRSIADALDYLSDEHGLQHLDIKPENLLMVGGHVKVADFGLIKDLHDASQSLMSGMTPAYAAPELFDGRPGAKSDQYSLAIVYQEMLTGIRPFPGQTPAQLAAQHVHGKPNLRPLPQSDQPIIAKALAKDPDARFESCRVMAEELFNRKRSTKKKAIRRIHSPGRNSEDTESNTIQLADSDSTAVATSAAFPFQTREIKSLDPPDCNGATATLQPTLLVGVGATANRVLKQLKQQMVSRHHSMEQVPAIRMLCFDTDQNDLGELCRSNDDSAFSPGEALATPLSKPETYRGKTDSRLSWLSRRWIYNIPRSLQTEGLRPLGRLAFAEHFDPICEKIESALAEIVAPENIATSAATLEMDPGTTQPRVFVISSISGGVGSGMTLDLAYTIKVLMAEHGLRTDTVTGVMLHSSYQRTRDRGLAAANAFAFLTELRHFVENGYPGDPSVGLPEMEDEPPFDYTYFQELGNDLSKTDFESKLSEIAEYIYLSSTSRCSAFFDGCRSLEQELEHFSLRTFGLSVSGPGSSKMGNSAAMNVARGLLRRWMNGDPDFEFDSVDYVQSKMAEFQLTPDIVLGRVGKLAEEALGGSFTAITMGAQELLRTRKSDGTGHLANYLDGALGCPPARRDSSHVDPEVCLELEETMATASIPLAKQVSASISELLNREQLDLVRATSSIATWKEKLNAACEQVQRASQLCLHNADLLLQEIATLVSSSSNAKRQDAERPALVKKYCELRFEELVLRNSVEFYRCVLKGLAKPESNLAQYTASLNSIKTLFSEEALPLDMLGDDSGFDMEQLLAESIDSELESLVTRTEVQLHESLVRDAGGYEALLDSATSLQHRLPTELKSAAQRVLSDAYKKISLEKLIADHNIGLEQLVKWMTENIRMARPMVDDCGGASRVLLGLPALADESAMGEIIERQFGLKVKTIPGTCGTFAFCFEGEDLSLSNVAFRLLQDRPDAVELVKRMHTRTDVQWCSLNDLL